MEQQSDRRLFSVAIVVQLLTSLIAGSEKNRGNLTVVGINKEVFSDGSIDESFIDSLGAELLPGVRSHLSYQRASQKDEIQLPKKLWDEINSLSLNSVAA